MAADKADLIIYQGDDYSAVVAVHNSDGSDADITGYTAAAQIRPDFADDTDTITAQFAATVVSPEVLLSLTHDVTSEILACKYVWDLQIVSPTGQITTILAGKATITPEVTRP